MTEPKADPIAAILDQLDREAMQLSERLAHDSALLERVNQARAALRANVGGTEEPVEFDGKLADAIRQVMRESGSKSFSPVEVRDAVAGIGFNIQPPPDGPHKNILAAIHGVLKRLVEQGDVRDKQAKDGSGTRYVWAAATSPPKPARQQPTSIFPNRYYLDPSLVQQIAESMHPERIAQLEAATKTMQKLMEQMPKFDIPDLKFIK